MSPAFKIGHCKWAVGRPGRWAAPGCKTVGVRTASYPDTIPFTPLGVWLSSVPFSQMNRGEPGLEKLHAVVHLEGTVAGPELNKTRATAFSERMLAEVLIRGDKNAPSRSLNIRNLRVFFWFAGYNNNSLNYKLVSHFKSWCLFSVAIAPFMSSTVDLRISPLGPARSYYSYFV